MDGSKTAGALRTGGEEDGMGADRQNTAGAAGSPAPRLSIDEKGRRALVDEREVALSRQEYDLLSAFAGRPGTALAHRELYDLVWKEDAPSSPKALAVAIGRLRRKLGPSFPIATLHGYGYRYDPIE